MQTCSMLQHGPVLGYQFGYSPTRFVKPFPVWCYRLGNTLIDTAQRHCQPSVLATFSGQEIDQILLTHFHEDHSGNVAALARQYHCPVITGDLTAQRIATSFKLMPYERFWFGAIDACSSDSGVEIKGLPAEISVGNYCLKPMPTLGHSDDHHVFLEPREGWLFAGDFYVGNLKFFRRGENIYQMIASTRAVLEHDFDTVFCGHNPVLANGKAAVTRKLNYLETIVERVQTGAKQGLQGQALLRAAGLNEQWGAKIFTQNDVGTDYLVLSVLNDA
jgi:glyoxylase-like metal-dependent hydrolase (beta-lactamase superfamily II)